MMHIHVYYTTPSLEHSIRSSLTQFKGDYTGTCTSISDLSEDIRTKEFIMI